MHNSRAHRDECSATKPQCHVVPVCEVAATIQRVLMTTEASSDHQVMPALTERVLLWGKYSKLARDGETKFDEETRLAKNTIVLIRVEVVIVGCHCHR